MPNTSSAKKALRSSLRKKVFNDNVKDKVRLTRRVLNKLFATSMKEAKNYTEPLSKYYSALDKAVKRNIIHKNKASRLKSRMAVKIDKFLKAE